MDYQGIGMITVFLILVSLFIWFMVSKMKNNQKNTKSIGPTAQTYGMITRPSLSI